MNLISIENISKSMGNKKLFSSVSFGINTGEKIALIGANGCGKTTMLNLIGGIEKTDSGNITKNKELKISVLTQNPIFDPEDSILEHIFNSDNSLMRLIKRYEEQCFIISRKHSENDQNEFHKTTIEMDRINAWEYEHQVKSILFELEINDLSQKMKDLSGGMIKKVSLAQALINDANLILLDEPTNHLDLKTISYLEEYLVKTDKSVVIVTHDRYFLDKICNIIFEIDRNTLYRYDGNYSYYLEKKSELVTNMIKEDARIENLMRKELEWYRRQPKARTTKSKSRMDTIEKLMEHEKYRAADEVEITVSGRRIGKKILELNNISKSFGKKIVIKPFSYVFKQNEKIGIIGPNGCGKTTLLNILTGILEPDSGTIDKGLNTVFGYFTQNKEEFDPDMRIIDYIKKIAEFITLDNGETISAGKMLERFLFAPDSHYTPISNLSGGEKRRLYLLKILMGNPNFIILDEPTNDIDINTLTVLENFLTSFSGLLLIVTHDRYFMNRVVDHIFVFDENGNIKSFPGNYSDYLEYESSREDKTKTVKSGNRPETVKKENIEKTKLTFKEKKELDELEIEIEDLENEKKELEKKFSGSGFDPGKNRQWEIRYAELEKIIEEKINRWEYLASF